MARCLLISFAGYPVEISSFFPDNGLASLAGTLISHGHEVKILDYNTVKELRRLVPGHLTQTLSAAEPALRGSLASETLRTLAAATSSLEEGISVFAKELALDIAEKVEEQHSQFVGFKLWSGDGFLASVAIAEFLRGRFPSLKLYGGGPAVLFCQGAIFNHTRAFDALVDGEGEEAILGLAAHAEGRGDLAEIPNLILPHGTSARHTRRSFVQNLDDLAIPEYGSDVYESLSDNRQIKLFVVGESRGCPVGCAFCVHKNASGRRWRVKSAKRVIYEMEMLHQEYGASAFRLSGSHTPKSFFRQFASGLSRAGMSVRFSGFSHPSGVPVDEIKSIADSGCKSLFFGVESFDDRDSESLGKTLNSAGARYTIKSCIDAGIVPVISLIMPLPGQSADSVAVNKRAVLELCRANKVSVILQFPALMPRTRWMAERGRFGFELQVDEESYKDLWATYQVRHMIPPELWEPLPYTVDGMDFARYAKVNADFQRELASEGVVINVADYTVHLADVVGASLLEMRGRLRAMLFSLDAPKIGDFVAMTNARIARS